MGRAIGNEENRGFAFGQRPNAGRYGAIGLHALANMQACGVVVDPSFGLAGEKGADHPTQSGRGVLNGDDGKEQRRDEEPVRKLRIIDYHRAREPEQVGAAEGEEPEAREAAVAGAEEGGGRAGEAFRQCISGGGETGGYHGGKRVLSSGLGILYASGWSCRRAAMLGYITGFAEGQANAFLADVAAALQAEGVTLAGVVQVNAGARGTMDLHVLGGVDVVRISQNLGPLSQGCRLDTAGLERAVGLVGMRMAAGVELLIVNRFGKQEAEGRGFRPLIGDALGAGVPVLLSVAQGYMAAFENFAGGMGRALVPQRAAVMEFCREGIC
jgi:hypothetical protein